MYNSGSYAKKSVSLQKFFLQYLFVLSHWGVGTHNTDKKYEYRAQTAYRGSFRSVWRDETTEQHHISTSLRARGQLRREDYTRHPPRLELTLLHTNLRKIATPYSLYNFHQAKDAVWDSTRRYIKGKTKTLKHTDFRIDRILGRLSVENQAGKLTEDAPAGKGTPFWENLLLFFFQKSMKVLLLAPYTF